MGILAHTFAKTLTLINNGDVATTALSMAPSSALPSGVSLTWDGGGKTVAAHNSLAVTFTLTSSVSTDVDLSFNVVISGA